MRKDRPRKAVGRGSSPGSGRWLAASCVFLCSSTPKMDALAEFTAMSPPREDGEDGGEMRRRRSLQDSAQSLDENFSSSQCSTDPSAFASFQATPGASLTRFPSSALLAGSGGEKRVRLTLDLMTAAGASTSVTPPSRGLDGSQPFGGSHFSELFSADTQDDEGRDVVAGPSLSDRRSPAASFVVAARVSAGSSHEEPKQSRRSTPPPSLLASVESAWLQRKRTKQPADCGEPVAGGLTDESRSSPSPRVEAASSSPDCDVPNSDNDRRSSIPGSSEYSEGLVQFELNAARIPTLAARKPAAGRSTSKETVPVRAPGVIAKQQQTGLSSERANDADEDEVACTEGFDNEHFASKVTIQGKATPDKSIDDESPQADTYSDTGTEPYVPSDDERDAAMDEEETEQFPNAEVADQGGSRVKSADDGMMAGGDLCSADAKPKYTTKREDSKLDNSSSLPGSDAASNADTTCQVKDPASSPTALANSEFQEPESRGFSDADEDDDDYPPTQPSKAFYSNSMSTPMEEEPPIVVPPKVALKKRDKVASTNQPTLTESQEKSYEFAGSECRCGSSACQCDSAQGAGTKSSAAIRNLEFSFAMPESQDTEPSQRNESVPDIDQVASKALQVFDQGCHGGDTLEDIVRGDKAMTSRKTTGSDINKSWQPTPKKAKKMQSPAGSASQTPVREASQQSVEATPTPNRKRKRVFTPSGSTQDDAESSDARATVNEVTPSRPPRRSVKRLVNNSTSSTPSSSQKVRTRPKELSPLPSTRAYISRSRTIFKFKFVFVVTGFSNKGETSMAELIQEHGGKVAEREQNVLYRGNTKAVVIATPVAWRKLKFMQAVACGISVVHPEWIHRCIKAASVLPFDGYTVPSGYSISTRKFECFPVQQVQTLCFWKLLSHCTPRLTHASCVRAMFTAECIFGLHVRHYYGREQLFGTAQRDGPPRRHHFEGVRSVRGPRGKSNRCCWACWEVK